MARRYYLTTLIGANTYADPIRTTIEARIRELQVADPAYAASIATAMPANARPGDTVLALLNVPDHTPFLADPRNDPLPEFPLDGRVAAIHGPTKAAMVAAMERRRIPTDDVDRADGFRDVIRSLGRRGKPEFNEDAFDAPDPK